MSIINKIQKHREETDALKWTGTFKEYLEIVKKNPTVAQSAHSRIYNMIMTSGVTTNDNEKKEYKFFSKEIYGLEHVFEKLVEEYFRPAALGYDVKKRLLLLMGPVSGGKSSILTLLKKGLEAYSRTDEGAVYAISGCPMNQEPLLLLSDELRKEAEKEFGIRIEGELNPYTREILVSKYGNILDVPVERMFLSELDRTGIGTFSPSDPKSQDISELIGSMDFSALGEYGSESDPRAYKFDGELNISNRGLMEFQEILKCDEKFLWHLLSLTQEGNFKAGRFPLISADEVVIAHTNETEYQRFVNDRKNEALISRMMVVHVPYNLVVEQEERIYQKMIRANEKGSLEPRALQTLATFSIMTRINEDDKVEMLDHYRGTATKTDVKPNRNNGMKGVDPRYIINRVSYGVSRFGEELDTYTLLKLVEDGLSEIPGVSDEELEGYKADIVSTQKIYEELLKDDFSKVCQQLEEGTVQVYLNNYLLELEKDDLGQNADQSMMKDLEDKINISDPQRKIFRDEILAKKVLAERRGQHFDINDHPKLKEAVAKIVSDRLKSIQSNDDASIERMANQFVDELGYSKSAALTVVKRLTNQIKTT